MPRIGLAGGARRGHLRALGGLALALVASWVLTIVYLFRFDALTSDFFLREARAQEQWAAHFTPADGPRLVITGGSSCTFSIDAGMATERFHVPVINAGLGAPIGVRGILLEASRLTRPGDTLVLAFEPALYGYPDGYTQDALRLLVRQLAWDQMARSEEVTGGAVPWGQLLFCPRPGFRSFSGFLGRLATGARFRYGTDSLKLGGLMISSLRVTFPGGGESPVITPQNRALLLHFRDWATRHGVTLVGSLPWLFTDRDIPGQTRANARFTSQLLELMPVVRDQTFSVRTDAGLFSDTKWHLTEQSAQVRTTELVRALLAKDYWTPASLAQAEARL